MLARSDIRPSRASVTVAVARGARGAGSSPFCYPASCSPSRKNGENNLIRSAGSLVVCGAAARRCGAFGPRSVVATSGRCRCGGYQRCVSSAVAPLLRSFRTEACASLLGRAHSCAASLDAVQAGDPAPPLAPPPRQLCLPLTTVFTATLNACPSSSQLFQQFSEMGLCRLCLFRGRVRGQQRPGQRCCGQRAGSLVCGASTRRCGAFGPRSVVATSGRRFASMATHTTSD